MMLCGAQDFFSLLHILGLPYFFCRGGSPAIQRMLGAGLVRKASIESLIPSLSIESMVRKMLELA